MQVADILGEAWASGCAGEWGPVKVFWCLKMHPSPGGVLLKELRQHGWEGVHALIFLLAKLYALPGEEGDDDDDAETHSIGVS